MLSLSSATSAPNNGAWSRFLDTNRRTAKTRALQYHDYGVGSNSNDHNNNHHPFEQYSSHRLNQEVPLVQSAWQGWGSDDDGNDDTDNDNNIFFQDNRVPLPTTQPTTDAPSPQPTVPPTIISYNPALYKPLRITMDSRNLDIFKESRPKKYKDLVDYLTITAAPKAAQFWSNHLSTIPVQGSISITEDDCPVVWWSDNNDSETHEFTNTDIIIYLLMDEGPCEDDDAPIAFSNDCAMDQYDRPTAGTLLLCSTNFKEIAIDSTKGRAQQQKLDEVLQHELAHILGMSGATMPYWRDASNGGKPYTSRPLVETDVVCINGETESIAMPSESTVVEGMTETGARYFEVVTPIVRNIVSNQFDCEGVTGARLDNNEFFNCIGSHWSPVSPVL